MPEKAVTAATHSLPHLPKEWKLLNHLPWPCWVISPQEEIILLNTKAGELMTQLKIPSPGISSLGLADKPFPLQQLLQHFDIGSLAQHKSLPPHWQGEWIHRRQDNTASNFLVHLLPFPEENTPGEKNQLIAMGCCLKKHTLHHTLRQDVSQQKISQLQAQLQRAHTDLERTFTELHRVDKVGHDLLNSLAKELMGPAKKIYSRTHELYAAQELLPANQQQDLKELIQQAELLKTILESIDHLVELQHDLQQPMPAQAELKNLVEEAFSESVFWQKQKNLKIDIQLPQQPVVVKTNRAQPGKLLNLLVRQLHLASHADSTIEVRSSLQKKEKQAQLYIMYQGMQLDAFAKQASEDKNQQRFIVWLTLMQRNLLENGGSLQFGKEASRAYLEITFPYGDKKQDDNTRVLICDEDKNYSAQVKRLVQKHWPDAQLLQLHDPFELLDRYDVFQPDLVVVDPQFSRPGWGNHRILSSLRQQRQHNCPVLAFSGLYNSDAERTVAAERGVSDYLPKPCSEFDLEFKLKNLLFHHRYELSMQHTMGQAQRQAYTDALTLLPNRKHFDEFLQVQLSYSQQTNKPCTLIMLDIDNFKHFNDTHGHQLGDALLTRVGDLLQKSVRSSDLAARYGGEEFALILPETNKDMAETIAEKVRRAFEAIDIPEAKQQPLGCISASLGVASFTADAKDSASLIKWADQCLYLAKKSGRNQVCSKPQ